MTRRLVALAWLCFVARGAFYSYLLPVWEGFDEWSHYAVIQHLATHGVSQLPDPARDRVSKEVDESLHLLPLTWEHRSWGGDYLTHDAWWRNLTDAERAARQQRVAALPSNGEMSAGPLIYEALQPPSYYWVSLPVFHATSGLSLPARVLLLRWWAILLASATIPLVWLIARRILPEPFALAATLVAASMPELSIDVARVANEALAVPLFSLLILLAMQLHEKPDNRRTAAWLGIVAGLGLLTKAYFLAAVPALLALILLSPRRRATAVNLALASAIAILISGWWFARNLALNGTLTGLSEAVTIRDFTLAQRVSGVLQVPWLRALDGVLLSHLWYGGWSGLGLRSWMYHLLYAIAALATVGVLRRLRGPLVIPALFYVFFWAAQAYNILLLFLSKGAATSMGWYLYAVVAAEVPLCCAGLFAVVPRRWLHAVLTACLTLFIAMEIYTVHFLLAPYYAGITVHRPEGPVQAFHLAQLGHAGLSRLTVNRGAGTQLLLGLWLCFLLANGALWLTWWRRRGWAAPE